MRALTEIFVRLKSLLFAAREHREVAEEIRFHIDKETVKNLAAGLSPREARRQAHIKFGGVERMRERTREARGVGALESWMYDVRHAARGLRKSQGFTFSALLILSLGIGATTALFSLVDAVLLSPLAYPQPEELVQIWETSPQGSERNPVSSGSAFTWQDEAESFRAVGMYRSGLTTSLILEGSPVLLNRATVHPSVFTVMNVPPLVGRRFVSGDATSGELLAVLSHATWQTYFGGDEGVLGQNVVLDDRPHAVIGVMPPGFDFPAMGSDLWTVLPEGSLGMERGDFADHTLSAVGRLRPGVSPETAEAELTTFAQRRARDDADAEGWGANVVPLHQEVTAESTTLLVALLAGAFIVLLVGCANLANLLLARGIRRSHEIAVRIAMGAGRSRVLRQLATENLLVGLLGGVVGILGSSLLLRAFVAAAPGDIPLLDRATIDWGVVGFALALSLVCALLFGLAPALRQTDVPAQAALRGARGSIGGSHGRIRDVLLASQVALAVLLVVGAGLFVRTVRTLATTDLGFDQEGLATMMFVLPARYGTLESQTRFVDQLVERVRAVPGVASVSEAMRPPGTTSMMSTPFVIEGLQGPGPDGRFDPEDVRSVWAGYFETVGQEVVLGRGITAEDRPDSRLVAVVNEALAAKLWPNEDPIGQRIAHPSFQQRGQWQEVVGVVSNARLDGADSAPVPRVYVPYAQHNQSWQTWGTIVARVSPGMDPSAVHEGMRAALGEVDPALAPRSLGSVEDAYREGLSRRTFAMALALSFACSVLLLSAFGLHGLVSFSVTNRRKEIGLRLALGGRTPDIVGTVLHRAMAVVAVGAVAGLLASLIATRTIESLLFGVERVDGVTYLATVVAIAAVALVATSLPAWRATRLDPVVALMPE